MPESASPPDIGHSKEHKFSSKSKWRGKLFAAEGIFGKGVGDHENDEEDVAHFLQPGTPKPGGTSTGTVKAPRIDTAKAPRWSSTSEGLETAPSEDKYHAAKPKQNKGLQVKFVSSVPEIIGEGGDESEIPVVHVSKERLSATAASSSRRIPFQRASTGPSEAVRDRLPANAYLSPENEVPNDASRPFEEDVRSQIPPRDAGDFFPNHNDMDEEFPRNSPVSRSHNEDETNVIEDTSDLTRSSSLLKPSTPFNIDASSNSLTPHAAPDPIPKLLTPSSPERGYFDVRHDGQSSTRKVPQLSPSLIQQEDAAAAAYAKQKPMSLRDVAKQVGSDALDDFDVRVRRFNEIFRLGVAVHQDTMEVPITRWIRTALWWFLKGRGELESAVRSRPRRVGSQDSSESLDLPADLKQAYMDLAKAWWIVKEITPNHPELRRFGDASMQSIIPIIQKFGDQTLAQLLETHVNLVANMRALAMSMKRNGRLPPSTIEIQRLDARVLLESPDLPSTVADTLLPLDNKSKHNSATASMPLGDTDYYFTFSRTFGAGSLTSRNHSFKAIHIPCIMSVLRAKDSLHLSALISSQDGRVEIAIKPERREGSGLTWRDVRWRTSALYIGISPEIELCIQMSEPDFKAVWNICDYTRKVQKDSHGREGEALVFECRLYDFQCLQSTRHPSSFPTNPVKGCRARLFGKTQTLSEDSGERRIHAGHRLMVMTTPQAKPLNSVSQVYGDGMPTIFGFGRRDGEPRLALRVPNLSQLLLRFENWEDLDLFYNVFTQRQISSDESRSGSLALQNFGIAPVSTEDQPASESAIRLPIHRWQQVKVISRGTANHDQSAALEERSRSLRIIAQCDQGILTDRLNLGEYVPSFFECHY